jgi:hypothetical protein
LKIYVSALKLTTFYVTGISPENEDLAKYSTSPVGQKP